MAEKKYWITLISSIKTFKQCVKKEFIPILFAVINSYIAPGFSVEFMRKILSEKNIAALLFVMVIIAFSFAHEDSKKRSSNYNVSSQSVSPDKSHPTLSIITPKTANSVSVK